MSLPGNKILFATLVLLLAVGAFAFNNAFTGTVAQASQFGHSADELVIRLNDGSLHTLQEIIPPLAAAQSQSPTWNPTACREICQTGSAVRDDTLLSCTTNEVVAKARWSKSPDHVDEERLCITCCAFA